MGLIKSVPAKGGIEHTFSHYQDAYKKSQRIETNTGYKQTPRKTSEGYIVFEPQREQQQIPQMPQQMMPSMGGQMQSMGPEIPEDLGYEFPPRQPPGLYDGKW